MKPGTSLYLTEKDLIGYVRGLRPLVMEGRWELFNKVVRPLILLADAQSSYLTTDDDIDGSHSLRVARSARRIGEILGFTNLEILNLECAALFHDVGKLLVERHLFLKNGKLTEEERNRVKFHVTAGVSIIYQIDYLTGIIPGVNDHHERWDGCGYPNHKAGEKISIPGRILSLADAYDAMTSPRPYRPPLGVERAKEEIEEHAGTQFDPEIAEAFLRDCQT
ncbi:MAG TPA: HD domain-containing protein [bacterium (Candidatus Stahlbacteria)]|nr:HD domain-containing protein [Candidatus Stahlbacteria bacterium]